MGNEVSVMSRVPSCFLFLFCFLTYQFSSGLFFIIVLLMLQGDVIKYLIQAAIHIISI